jgi:heavy metal sensor kinase
MLIDKIPVRLRLSLVHVIWLILLFSGMGVGIFQVVESNLSASLDASLKSSAYAIRDARFNQGFGNSLMRQFLEEYMGERFIRSHAQIVDLSGKITHNSLADLKSKLPVTPRAIRRAERGQDTLESFNHKKHLPIRQITVPVMSRRRFTGELIQIAAPLDSLKATMLHINSLLWISLTGGVLVSGIFGYLLATRSLKPVRQISSAASKMSSDDMKQRLVLPAANDELRHLTTTFNQMLDRLEDGFMRLRRFSGDVSHELRTPITVLKAEADFALKRERTTTEYRDALKKISHEANHMAAVVQDLLLLARASGHSLDIQAEFFSLQKLIDSINVDILPLANQKSITLNYHLEEQQQVFGAEHYVGMILRNLIQNAIRYSSQQTTVTINAKTIKQHTHISVTDCGIGIPEDALPYVFDPFYRTDQARCRATGGSGLGLSLSLALAKLHQGNITAQSIVEQGSCFTLNLPKSHDISTTASKENTSFSQRTPLT